MGCQELEVRGTLRQTCFAISAQSNADNTTTADEMSAEVVSNPQEMSPDTGTEHAVTQHADSGLRVDSQQHLVQGSTRVSALEEELRQTRAELTYVKSTLSYKVLSTPWCRMLFNVRNHSHRRSASTLMGLFLCAFLLRSKGLRS